MKLIAAIVLFTLSCFQSQSQCEHENGLLLTDWEKYNLKGCPKEIIVRFQRHYEPAKDRDRTAEFEFNNFWSRRDFPQGKWLFSENGFIELKNQRFQDDTTVYRTIHLLNETIYEYFYPAEDISNKIHLGNRENYPFPIFEPGRIVPNRIMRFEYFKESRDTIELFWEYVFSDDGKRIESEVYSRGEIERIATRSHCGYDSLDRISRIDFTLNEWLPESKLLFDQEALRIGVSSNYMAFSLSDEIYYSFDYDTQDRLIKAQLYENGILGWQEDYTYNESSRVPFRVDRFETNKFKLARSRNLNNLAKEWYNDFGDPIKTEDLDDNDEIVRTRFYEYVYDDRNNWIQCDMYLEGGPEKTSLPTIIMHRDIQYYTESEVEAARERLKKIKD